VKRKKKKGGGKQNAPFPAKKKEKKHVYLWKVRGGRGPSFGYSRTPLRGCDTACYGKKRVSFLIGGG